MADGNRDAIKALYMQERGYWRPWNDVLLNRRASFLQAYAQYAGYPASKAALTERMVELVYVALDASATHLFPTGLKLHMQKALACGASDDDILDVLILVCLQGAMGAVNALDDVVDIYGDLEGVDEAARSSAMPDALPVSPELLARLLPMDPAYFAHLQQLAQTGRSAAGLSAQERCLITVALHACFTGVNRSALRASVSQAKALGVARDALVQVIQMGTHLAVHGTALGATTLAELASA